jgi:ribosomal protein S18 acetylase RimI-like enzyme
MPNAISRLRNAVRRDGPVTVVRHVAQRAAHRLYLSEDHIWYSLELNGDRPRRDLPDGFELQVAAEGDAEAIARLPNQPAIDGLRARIAGDADVYVVRAEGKPAFACTIFRERAPVIAARGGWLDLPGDTVVLEDSGTSPDFRGRGVAPGAWSAIADAVAARGYETMLTKVTVENEASRKAVMKAGFREAADMRMRRRGPVTKVAMSALGAPGAEFIASLVAR